MDEGEVGLKTVLVGSTGFVGGNLAAQYSFDEMYHSTNVQQAFGSSPDLLVYVGMPAAKYLSNQDPEKDWQVAENACRNIQKINPRKLVLISTVDVYANPLGADEDTPGDLDQPQAYGRNRARLEQIVRLQCPDALILRLPGLFGIGLKKNFIYDFLHRTPSMLNDTMYRKLSQESDLVAQCYESQGNGFWKQVAPANKKIELENWFAKNDFNALCFTDSRSSYQFYDLACLWKDISFGLMEGLPLLNLSVEPLRVSELYAYLTDGKSFCNECAQPPAYYDMRSKYAGCFEGGKDGYCYDKEAVLRQIAAFVDRERAAMRTEND